MTSGSRTGSTPPALSSASRRVSRRRRSSPEPRLGPDELVVRAALRRRHAAHGGDYDVLACVEGEVAYVETKSAPPRQIDQSEVGAFLDRVDTLRPDLALFLVDTQLRMKDKLVPMFAAEVDRRRLGWDARRLEREIWRVGPEVYLL